MRWHEIIRENAHIVGLRPRFEDIELSKNDLMKFAEKADSAEAFATRLAEPGGPAYAKLIQFWNEGKAAGFPVEQETKFVIPYVGQLIAKKLGATGYKNIVSGANLPWKHGELFGGNGYVITTPEGRVFLDATLEDKTIYMAQISVEDRTSGLGTKTMNAIREVAQENHWKVCVYKVTNKKFFQKFPWLSEKQPGTFTSLEEDAAESKYKTGEKYHAKIPEIKYLPVSLIHRQEMDHMPEVMSVSDEVARNMDFSEPVEVTAFRFAHGGDDDQTPEVTLRDGHHRTAAALQTGREWLPVDCRSINAKGEKINALIAISNQIEARL